MTEDQHHNQRFGRGSAACVFAAAVLALGVCTPPAASRAAGPPDSTPVAELGALLATNTIVLSEDAMAQQKGSGLRAPPVISNGHDPGGPAKVLLWDEMRIAPLLNPPNDGVVTGGTGGR